MPPDEGLSIKIPAHQTTLDLLLRHGVHDVRVTGVGDAEARDAEVAAARGPEVVVVTAEVVDLGLGEHGVVLELGLAEARHVLGDDHELGLAGAQRLERGLVPEGVLARLHHQLQGAVDRLVRLLLGFDHDLRSFKSFSDLSGGARGRWVDVMEEHEDGCQSEASKYERDAGGRENDAEIVIEQNQVHEEPRR